MKEFNRKHISQHELELTGSRDAKDRHPDQVNRQQREEEQPLPRVLDILERRAQLNERWGRVRYGPGDKRSRDYRALRREIHEQVRELGSEAASHYPDWSERDQLMFDLYTTSADWSIGRTAQHTQEFMASVAPLSAEELTEELRKATEVAERKAASTKKFAETRERQKGLPPEERKRLRNERARDYQRRKKESRLQAEKSRPSQVFPPPANE